MEETIILGRHDNHGHIHPSRDSTRKNFQRDMVAFIAQRGATGASGEQLETFACSLPYAITYDDFFAGLLVATSVSAIYLVGFDAPFYVTKEHLQHSMLLPGTRP